METDKKTEKTKDFDAVKMMRGIRDKINEETKGMTFKELRKYMDAKLKNIPRLVGE